MVQSASGPRVLLRQLRSVMADRETAQSKLDRIVTLIASNVVAEVCSLYVMRQDDTLELFATEGLNREAVHNTFLKLGEGLVGTIARDAEILNLTDAQTHPAFKYLPETGEEIYSSFLGVPILRGGRSIGVLVVQNRTRRQYSEEEEEALQTTTMVLAELVASGELTEVAETVAVRADRVRPLQFTGDALVDGVALGHAVLHRPRVVITNLIAESVPDEQVRLEEGIDLLRIQVDDLISHPALEKAGEHDEVLETVRMFAYDRGWVRRMREAVATGLTAEAAVERVQGDNRARLQRQHDPYLRERMHDLDDLSNRLLRILTGQTERASSGELPRDTILIARNMGPAELLDYDREKLRGLVLEESGRNSHVAIVARALGVPTAGDVSGILETVDTGTPIIIDGATGDVHVRPPADIEEMYAEKVRFHAKRQAQYRELRDKPSTTRDGVEVSLNINAGLRVDLPQLDESGADGIGLYRTELHFMLAKSFPRRGEQIDHYRSILEAAEGRPVVFRSLDIGSDKMLPYFRNATEENPAMGWRAIRIALDRPALLRLQIRCMLTAAAGRELKLMFPMIAEVDEFRAARAIVDKECEFLRVRNEELPLSIKLGAMLEVPSILWQLDQLLPLVDFVSIGSNDLMQFMFACDRTHPRLANRYDPLCPSVLKAIGHVAKACQGHDVPLTLCGEMAGRPLEAMALTGLGLRSLSMAPSSVGAVKTMIRSLDCARLEAHLMDAMKEPVPSIRNSLIAFAEREGVEI